MYTKDSRMVYYFRLEFEVQIDAHSIAHNTLRGGRGFD